MPSPVFRMPRGCSAWSKADNLRLAMFQRWSRFARCGEDGLRTHKSRQFRAVLRRCAKHRQLQRFRFSKVHAEFSIESCAAARWQFEFRAVGKRVEKGVRAISQFAGGGMHG